MIGLVVFSFGLRSPDDEPNPCNKRLGLSVQTILANEEAEVIIVSQWEVAKQLDKLGIESRQVVNLKMDGSYLATRDVWAEASAVFKELDITKVVVVANPFFQLAYAKRMVRGDGFTVIKKHVGHSGFDNSLQNTQPWTRNRVAFIAQIIKIVFWRRAHG